MLAFQNHYSASFVRYNPVVRIREFLAGILIGRAFYLLKRSRHWLWGSGHFLYVPAIITELLVILPLQPQVAHSPAMSIFLYNGLLLPLHSMTLLGLALGGGFPARILSGRVISFLGEASYSMYIIHYPLFKWITVISKQLHLPQLHGYRGALLYVTAVICVAALMVKFVERPFTRLIRRKWQNSIRVTPSAARVLVLPVLLIRKPG